MSINIASLPDDTNYDTESGLLAVRQTTIPDLITLYQTLDKSHPWKDLEIYADHLTVDFDGRKHFGIDLSGDKNSITIITRKLSLKGGKNFFILSTDGDGAKANIRIQQLEGATALNFPGTIDHGKQSLPNTDFPSSDAFAINNTITFNESADIAAFNAPSSLAIGSAFYWILVQSFQTAFIESASNRTEALSLFNWIKDNTASTMWSGDISYEMPSMGTQAVAMISSMNRNADVNYVPKLSLMSYQETVVTNAETALDIEKLFNDFMGEETTIAKSQETAKLMQVDVATMMAVLDDEISGTKSRIQTAVEQLSSNQAAFNSQRSGLRGKNDDPKPMGQDGQPAAQGKMEAARIALQVALDKKEEEAKKQAVMDAFGAVLSLGSAVMGNFTGVIEGVTSVVKAIQTIIELLETVNKAIETIDKLVGMTDKLSAGENGQFDTSDLTIPKDAGSSLSSTQWATLTENWKAFLEPYATNNSTNSGISGPAADYMAQGNILFIYGQAVTDSSVSLANLQRTLVLQLMKKKLYDQQVTKINGFINDDQTQKENIDQIALLLQQRYFDVKRQLLLQIQDFNDAFRYWALQEPSQTDALSFTSSISGPGGIAAVAKDLNDEITEAMTDFTNQSEKVICHISQDLAQTDIETLKSGHKFYLPVQMDNPVFTGFNRVRVEYVEVLFDDLNTSANKSKTYYCKVQNGGSYVDRLLPFSEWVFSAEYTIDAFFSSAISSLSVDEKTTKDSITNEPMKAGNAGVSNLLGDESGYYTPSLFTTWIISLPTRNSDNSSLDWSAVKSIKLILHGNAMGGS